MDLLVLKGDGGLALSARSQWCVVVVWSSHPCDFVCILRLHDGPAFSRKAWMLLFPDSLLRLVLQRGLKSESQRFRSHRVPKFPPLRPIFVRWVWSVFVALAMAGSIHLPVGVARLGDCVVIFAPFGFVDMALESCEGGELFDQITRKGRLSEDEARFYSAQVVDALEYIHTMGLIHRDIKPENLLLTSDGHIKIADFGSVKPMQDSQITLLPNAASDDKACTFVGTAAYVPPEVLNSSPATFGNDLWALGCTLYQMLSGTSPFKDASEWLIFQRIIARDIKFPNHFSEAARDLIDRLLDTDPSRRPGAGSDGYASLKRHPFFKGVDWKNVRSQTPPKLAPDPSSQSASPERDGSPWNPTHVGDASVTQNDGHGGVSSATESSGSITRLASIDSFDSRWQQFLEPGESVLMISAVKKLQKITSKKVQLILTNKPRLIYVDPSKLIVKGNIIWSDNSNDLNVQVSSPSHFKICTPKKVLSFEDSKQRALQWKKAIETLQNR
ncbi:hypothetical protein F2Q68_00032996 [Brassica cretica]|uniref:Protein kinase domain-containing protein n=1 Tax=Brassica cretica TaxID=69181 RepID=A0A8S9GHN7_BRACR|nr:hypothetical protein F2Q68_00032996 [Brassica cretica]